MDEFSFSNEENQSVSPAGRTEQANATGKNPLKRTMIILSTTALLMLAALYATFLGGTYDLLHAIAILTLLVLPVTLIGGSIWCGIKRKWFCLGLAFILLPPAWLITLLGAMSEFPLNPSHRPLHAAVLISGACACWLFLTIAFWPARPKRAKNTTRSIK